MIQLCSVQTLLTHLRRTIASSPTSRNRTNKKNYGKVKNLTFEAEV